MQLIRLMLQVLYARPRCTWSFLLEPFFKKINNFRAVPSHQTGPVKAAVVGDGGGVTVANHGGDQELQEKPLAGKEAAPTFRLETTSFAANQPTRL